MKLSNIVALQLYNKNSYKVAVTLLCQPLFFSHKHYYFMPEVSKYGTKNAAYIISLSCSEMKTKKRKQINNVTPTSDVTEAV